MGATCEAERYFPGDLKLKPNFLNEFDINYVGMELFFTPHFSTSVGSVFVFRSSPAASPIAQLLIRSEQSQPQSGPGRIPNPSSACFVFFSVIVTVRILPRSQIEMLTVSEC